MRRRDFITALGGAAVWPILAQAQTPAKLHHIAVVHLSHPVSELTETSSILAWRTFFEELRRLGYVEGKNLAVARYSGGGRTERYAELARDVVRTKPDVIVTVSIQMVRYFKAASSTIPIVANTSDPVAFGVAASLARPGGNYTGATADGGPEVYAKQLELLREAVPTLTAVGLHISSIGWESSLGLAAREAAQHLGIRLVLDKRDSFQEADYRAAFAAMAQARVDAVLLTDRPEHLTHRRLLVELSDTYRLPTISPYSEIVEVGGLIAYSPDRKEAYRYTAGCIDRILQGTNPGEIPILQVARFQLSINLKTAKALGLVIPASLLARADLVIE